MAADAAGRAVAFRIAPGQAHELPHAVSLLAQMPDVPLWVVATRYEKAAAVGWLRR